MAKILIVDDDRETGELLDAIVRSDGHTALVVNESTRALKMIEDTRPDLILMDIMMPQINGIAICKQVKSDPALQGIHVLMISALADEGTKKDAFNAGATAFVTKPILPSKLLEQINSLLR